MIMGTHSAVELTSGKSYANDTLYTINKVKLHICEQQQIAPGNVSLKKLVMIETG